MIGAGEPRDLAALVVPRAGWLESAGDPWEPWRLCDPAGAVVGPVAAYVAAVKGTTSAHAGQARPVTPALRGGPGRPPGPAYPDPPAYLRQLAIANADKIQRVTWRQGTRATRGNPTAAMTSCFLAIRSAPPTGTFPARPTAACQNAGCWPNGPPKPTSPAITGCPAIPPARVEDLVRLAKIRWRIEHDYRELKHGLGLGHFEGRSFTGWHRHVTLTALAQAFCTQIRTGPKARAPG